MLAPVIDPALTNSFKVASRNASTTDLGFMSEGINERQEKTQDCVAPAVTGNNLKHEQSLGQSLPSSQESSHQLTSGMSQEQLISTAQALMSELAMDINNPVTPQVSSSSFETNLSDEPKPVRDSASKQDSSSKLISDLDLEISQIRRSNETATHQLQLLNSQEDSLQSVSRNVCAFCGHRVLVGPYYDVGGGKRVHVECFRCSNCKAPLTQFQCLNDTYLCPKCAHEMRPAAKCVACGKAVTSDNTVVALNAEWHISCFRCAHCRKILNNDFVELNGKPYCLPRDSPCYRFAQGKVCCVCSGVLDVSYLTVFDKFYHRTCFCCSGCGVPFPSLEFFQINKQPYCETCATQIIGDQLGADPVPNPVTVSQ